MATIKYAVLCNRGTSEPASTGRPLGMLKGVADYIDAHLPAARKALAGSASGIPDIQVHYYGLSTAQYKAQYANPGSYGTSKDNAIAPFRRLLDTLHSRGYAKCAVVGYSQGCTVSNYGLKVYQNSEVISGNYLLADALRPLGANSSGYAPSGATGLGHALDNPKYVHNNAFHGYGVAGDAARLGLIVSPAYPYRWYTIPGDVISDCYADSMVRDVADVSEYMGFTSPDDMVKWATDVIAKLQDNRWQNLPWYEKALAGILKGNPMPAIDVATVFGRSVQEGLTYPRVHTSYGAVKFPGDPSGLTYVQRIGADILQDWGLKSR